MTIGRPLQFDPDASLERAMETFWAQGYEATSMQDLLRAMNLSKSSLYQFYGNKQNLFERCLAHYCSVQTAQMRRQLDASDSGVAFIEDLFRQTARGAGETSGRRGCLLMNTASELGSRVPWVGDPVATGKHAFSEVFRAAILRAQQEGDVPFEHNAESLALYLVSSMSGLRTQLKAGTSVEQADAIIDAVLRALK